MPNRIALDRTDSRTRPDAARPHTRPAVLRLQHRLRTGCCSGSNARGTRRRAALALALLALAACGDAARDREAPPRPLALAEPLPRQFAPGTRLILGDPVTQKQLEQADELAALPFVVEWQNLTGGPQTIEAFRAGALHGGSVGDTPPIHARFTGLDVRIIAVTERSRPIYRLAVAPGSAVESIGDLRGKRIAYSPGQAQGALVLRVLRKAGLSRQDVQLVEIQSPEFKDALASRQVDVAPLSGVVLQRYLNEYGREGATAISHGGVSDSLGFFYVDAAVLADADRAAALHEYVRRRIGAQRWAETHADAWIDAYYVRDQGLTREEGRAIVDTQGWPEHPHDWSRAIALTQETIDLLAEASGRASFRAEEIFDRRFETAARPPDALAAELPAAEVAQR